jgi:predicted TIM-barrel fold metal-dependent hydrolase
LTAAIDCDVHPQVPNLKALMPYLEPYWRDSFVERGIPGFESNTYPPGTPLSVRADFKGKEHPATDVTRLSAQVFDRLKAETAICNCLYGVELIFSEDMALAVARAVNDWIAKEWLDRDPRLRASIVVPTQNVEFAVSEIERCAKDNRFVQVVLLAMQESPLGRRPSRPADRHSSRLDLPPLADLARLADVLSRGLCGLCAGVPVAADEPDQRRRVCQVPGPQGGID